MNFLRLFQSESSSVVLGGRYRVLRQLGEGGFGQTFLAEDLHLPGNPRCVVKRLQPHFDDPTTLQMAKRLFDTEAQTLYALGNHDQIPKLLAHFEQEEEFYLVQELIVGHSLSTEVRDDHPWSAAQVVGLMRDILEVLAFVHQQQVIHRDIKPANMIRRHADYKLVLIDFGAVKQATQISDAGTQSALTIAIGTPGYMPNEQVAGHPRFSSDVYAVGMIGIHALTGIAPKSLPKDPETSEIVWQDQVASLNAEVADILDRMVRYDFRARYATAAEALAAIAQLSIAPEPSPFQQAQSELASNFTLTDSVLAETALAPTETERSQISQASQVSAPTQTATLPPPSLLPAPAPLQRFMRRPPKKFALVAAGMAGVVALLAIARPLISSHPERNPSTAASQAEMLLSKADQLRQQQQYQQSIAVYDEAIALDPNAAAAHWGRCYCLNRLKQFAQAIESCNQALKLNPNDAQALWSKGYALDQQGQHQAALNLFDQAIAQKPDFAEAWVNKGATLMRLNRPADALTAFDQAIALNANLAEAWSNRATALWRLRRFDEAIAAVDRAIEIQPDYPEAETLRQQMRQQFGKGVGS